jgi:hypothetical protein
VTCHLKSDQNFKEPDLRVNHIDSPVT